MDGLKAHGAALKEIRAEDRQVTRRWLNNRAAISNQPFRRRERAMLRVRRLHGLQKFVAVHSSACSHFNSGRSLSSRNVHEMSRTAAPAERRQLVRTSVRRTCPN